MQIEPFARVEDADPGVQQASSTIPILYRHERSRGDDRTYCNAILDKAAHSDSRLENLWEGLSSSTLKCR